MQVINEMREIGGEYTILHFSCGDNNKAHSKDLTVYRKGKAKERNDSMPARQAKPRVFCHLMTATVLCGTQMLPASGRAEGADKPNVLFILSDDHSREAISSYSGGRLNQTPNLDRIANEGMRFDECFCVSALCAPSRATILTGKYSHINGLTQLWDYMKNRRTAFDNSQNTVVTYLKEAGYQTAVFGKWHLNCEPVGFDAYEILGGKWGQGKYFDPLFVTKTGENTYPGKYVTDVITRLEPGLAEE